MGVVFALVAGLWFFVGGGIWWFSGALIFAAMMFAGEDLIYRWIFFISVVSGSVWLFSKYFMGIEL